MYHRMPFRPDAQWQWDLSGDEAQYLGGFDFAGERVLEIGCAEGALTFWMARQGADVVAVDLGPDPDATPWDVLLRPGDDPGPFRSRAIAGAGDRNAVWQHAREYYDATAQLVLSTAYDIPRSLGTFDVVTLGAVLLHLRDPIRALEHVVEFTRDAIIVTEMLPRAISEVGSEKPIAYFVPSPEKRTAHGGLTWWHFSPVLLERYLALKGFAVERTVGQFRHRSGPQKMFTIVGRRTS